MQVPECNSSWSDGHIRQYSAADISVAVNTDRGLLTPIVFGADSKSISDINADVRSLCVSVRRAAPWLDVAVAAAGPTRGRTAETDGAMHVPGALARREGEGEQAEAGGVPRRHVHRLEPRHVRRQTVHRDHQRAAGTTATALSRATAKFPPAAPAQAASRTHRVVSIANAPQACILAVGGAETKAVPDGAGGVSTKSVMLVSLSSDHRVVDGALAAAWLQSFKRHMENPLLLVL